MILFICIVLTSCSGKEKKEYSDIQAVGCGKIATVDNGFEITLQNIFSGKGQEIDYLGNIEIASGCEVNVDSSSVNLYEPGDYRVIYTVTKGNQTASETITLTIKDDGKEETTTEADAETFKSEEVQTDSNVTYPVQKAQTAEIELMSGKVVKIPCTTQRYIVSTQTDSSVVVKKKQKYTVKKLIVVFNTGEEQVLETNVSK